MRSKNVCTEHAEMGRVQSTPPRRVLHPQTSDLKLVVVISSRRLRIGKATEGLVNQLSLPMRCAMHSHIHSSVVL